MKMVDLLLQETANVTRTVDGTCGFAGSVTEPGRPRPTNQACGERMSIVLAGSLMLGFVGQDAIDD